MFFKVFLRKIISTISNSSYTSQIHCRNALRLDPVVLYLTVKCPNFKISISNDNFDFYCCYKVRVCSMMKKNEMISFIYTLFQIKCIHK